jgi:hypothetical protein
LAIADGGFSFERSGNPKKILTIILAKAVAFCPRDSYISVKQAPLDLQVVLW